MTTGAPPSLQPAVGKLATVEELLVWCRAHRAWWLVLLAACGDANVDGTPADARVIPDGSSEVDDALQEPYRHAIALDGLDDFATGDQFATTSTAFAARITWDDKNLYIGYSGPDLATTTDDAGTKWLFVYLDTTAGGVAQSELYRTQRVTFPVGFAADYYARYKVDGTLTSLKRNDGGAWNEAAPPPAAEQADTFVEMALPFTAIGATTELGIVTYMINEKDLAEGTYAGLYETNFTDGYGANLPLTAYLHADLESPRAPNDPMNRKP